MIHRDCPRCGHEMRDDGPADVLTRSGDVRLGWHVSCTNPECGFTGLVPGERWEPSEIVEAVEQVATMSDAELLDAANRHRWWRK